MSRSRAASSTQRKTPCGADDEQASTENIVHEGNGLEVDGELGLVGVDLRAVLALEGR